MGNTKKKMMTAAIAGSLAAAMVVGGGTFAYLSQQTDQVTNEFKPNHALVEISETDNDYEIIPGTEQDKDPSLTPNVTLDSYLYAIVTDETEGLVSYTVADGWTKLADLSDGTKSVYYRKVTEADNGTAFNILKDNKVSYDTGITNDDMKDDAKLKFRGFVIQAKPFKTADNTDNEAALAAYNQTHVTATAADLATKIANAEDGQIITLEEDVTGGVVIDNDKEFTLDLGGKSVGGMITLKSGDVTIDNGTLSDNYCGIWIQQKDPNKPVNLTVGEDAVIKGSYGVVVRQSEDNGAAANATIDMKGTIEDGCIFVLGNIKNDATVINIYGKVTSSDDVAVCGNGYATINVKSGAEITGSTGIEMRAGVLNVEDGATIVATAIPTSITPNGNGTTTTGAGIGVSQHTTGQAITVNVSGGTIKGYTPLYEEAVQNSTDEQLAKININVTGGTFECTNNGPVQFNIVDKDKITYNNVYDQQP